MLNSFNFLMRRFLYILIIVLTMLYMMIVWVAQGRCGETCTSSYKNICRDHRSDNTCKAFCSERFGALRVCSADCVDEDETIYCQCTLQIDACP